MNEPLASEIYKDLKATIKFLKILVVVLVAVIAMMAVYHEYLWSQYETIVVDSGEGSANYVGGENSGGIFNGTDSSSAAEEREIPGQTDSAD